MGGHVFVIRGDLRRLACDARMIPCDSRARPLPALRSSHVRLPPASGLPSGWKNRRTRLHRLEKASAGPVPWIVNVESSSGRNQESYLRGVKEFIDRASRWATRRRAWFQRARPLLALPLPADEPRAGSSSRGHLVGDLLELLRRSLAHRSVDVAVVAADGPAFAAAQAARHQQRHDPWPELNRDIRSQAERLAELASGQELAVFLGAGVSASAGLPLWGELLERLAEKAGMSAAEREALHPLNPLDQAGIIEKRLGGTNGLQQTIRRLFTWDYYALTHALLAGLPVKEMVTTNYDQLLETALQSQGRCPSVLPYEIHPDADCWLLKMHGCVAHPEDIVVTREDQIGFSRQHDALAGIVQTLLITRHMLFVGFSLNDDNFHRIVDAVRRVIRRSNHRGRDVKPFGTVLVLERNPLIEELWGDDLRWIEMDGSRRHRGARAADQTLEAARRLETFLDYLLAQIHDEAHLLDSRYPELLTREERALRDALVPLARSVPQSARGVPAWRRVETLLQSFGLSGPLASSRKKRPLH